MLSTSVIYYVAVFSSQFKLGALVTEASHPVTANLSVEAKLVMKALSTCTMVRLGRVAGN